MKYPNIKVEITDGNAFSIMGAIRNALKENEVPADEISEFLKECKSGDYDNLLMTCMDWVDIEVTH